MNSDDVLAAWRNLSPVNSEETAVRAGMRLEPRKTMSDETETVLRELILSGNLRPGSRLNEVALAASLGISRGPLREALQRLTAEGLLTLVPRRGAHVRVFEASELRDLYELREALEMHAIKLAARRDLTAEFAGLDELLASTGKELQEGQSYPHHLDFHAVIVHLSGNAALASAASDVHRQIRLARAFSAHDHARAKLALQEHEAILLALKSGDGSAAEEAMLQHLRHSATSAIGVMDRETKQESTQVSGLTSESIKAI